MKCQSSLPSSSSSSLPSLIKLKAMDDGPSFLPLLSAAPDRRPGPKVLEMCDGAIIYLNSIHTRTDQESAVCFKGSVDDVNTLNPSFAFTLPFFASKLSLPQSPFHSSLSLQNKTYGPPPLLPHVRLLHLLLLFFHSAYLSSSTTTHPSSKILLFAFLFLVFAP